MSPSVFEILLTLKDGASEAETVLGRVRDLGISRPPAIASFYRTLKKAIDSGYVEILEPSDPPGRGRPPQRYRITASGKTALRAEARRLGKLSRLALSESPHMGKG